ncbi:MAG TPA: NADH-quinone oxidoreductase subunit L [Myxococcales bacterium]|nr:NADH-quinone oxidoreductase subunit L [Myxococcales bacterium]
MEVSWLYLIPLLPLAGAAVNGLVGRWLPKAWLYAVALLTVLLSFCIGLFAWSQMAGLEGEAAQLRQIVFGWFSVGSLRVDLGLAFDRLSGTMVLVVTGVGFLIHLYSVGYMDEDPAYWRYFAYLNLFVSMMLLLVLADNLVAMFVGWEGVGLCSYLLIGFWYDDETKAYAGRKAFIVNRIGDFGFLIGIFVVYFYTSQVSFHALKVAPLSLGVASASAALLFVGAIGKSAQLPLYVWLPDAMAGPTPVSALIHAATMVTAGVYMVARLSFLYVQAPGVMAVVATIGVLTAFWGAVIGTAQMDIKRVLAYSTVSQLGYMFVGVGVGAFAAGTAHLITHAFFKACLFLGSGAVIHGLHDEQDMTRMGGLRKLGLKHTAATFFIATVTITGLLPFGGFFSKDEILAQALNTRAFDFLTLLPNPASPRLSFLGPAIYVAGTVTALITSFYMWRCYLLTFEGEYRGPAEVHPHEAPWVMTLPLWVLAGLSVASALIVLPSHQLPFTWAHFTEGVFARPRGGAPVERLPELVAFGIALLVAWAGFAAAWSLYAPGRALEGDERIAGAVPRLRRALAAALYVDGFYDRAFVKPLWATARALWRVVDATLIDGLLVNGPAQAVAAIASVLRRFQNGDVQRYAAVTAVGVLILVYVFLVRG